MATSWKHGIDTAQESWANALTALEDVTIDTDPNDLLYALITAMTRNDTNPIELMIILMMLKKFQSIPGSEKAPKKTADPDTLRLAISTAHGKSSRQFFWQELRSIGL
jgi:hypothetical protein